ncbi:hypothetical protein OC834_004861 [Tilletia horrida]|nr:hypothetical protein OC834_004861 [Tilletia horrida]
MTHAVGKDPGKAKRADSGPVAELLAVDQKVLVQREWIRDTLQISGGLFKPTENAMPSGFTSARRGGPMLTLGARGEPEAIAEEIVACLSLLQGLAVCDKRSRTACTSRSALESILLFLSTPHLSEMDLTAPACHALDLLMCVLVDAEDHVSDLFEALGGIDEISSVWKARAEMVAMRSAAARVEREAAKLRRGSNLPRRSRPGTPRAASDGTAGMESPSKAARRAVSEDEEVLQPSTPARRNQNAAHQKSFSNVAPTKHSAQQLGPASPATPKIPLRSSSAVDALSDDGVGSPRQLLSDLPGGPEAAATSRQSDVADRPGQRRRKPLRSFKGEPDAPRVTSSDDGEQEEEPDELCEKCIEFLIFYLQPELLEKEAARERRLKAKVENGTVLQLSMQHARDARDASQADKKAVSRSEKPSALAANPADVHRSPRKARRV